MAKLHVGQSGGGNVYSCVAHAPTPAGPNAAGVPWKTALVNSGPPVTTMVVGNGPGQITQSEANDVADGDIIEAPFDWQDNPFWTPAERDEDLLARATAKVASTIEEMKVRLQWWGKVVT